MTRASSYTFTCSFKKIMMKFIPVPLTYSAWFMGLFSSNKSLLLQVRSIFPFLVLLYNRNIKSLLGLLFLKKSLFYPRLWIILCNALIEELFASCLMNLDPMCKLTITKSDFSSWTPNTRIHFFQICFPWALTHLSKWHHRIQLLS